MEEALGELVAVAHHTARLAPAVDVARAPGKEKEVQALELSRGTLEAGVHLLQRVLPSAAGEAAVMQERGVAATSLHELARLEGTSLEDTLQRSGDGERVVLNAEGIDQDVQRACSEACGDTLAEAGAEAHHGLTVAESRRRGREADGGRERDHLLVGLSRTAARAAVTA